MNRFSWMLETVGAVPGLTLVLVVVLAAALGLVAHAILFHLLGRAAARRTGPSLESALVRHARRASRFLIPVFFASLALSVALPTAAARGPAERLLSVLLVAGIAWLLIALTRVVQERVEQRYRIDVADNLQARKIHTQFDLIRKVVVVVLVLLAGALILMSFEGFRTVGAGLLASAGIAGLVLGLAAQKTLGNLFAGLQIALTQPIRVDDVVVVEGEWGRIEEITLTYVVVRIWDLRRLILPVSYFIENPFQNWTRVSADILGTVFLHADYRVPVDDLRAELRRLLDADDRWDGKVCVLHVTDAGAHTVELRALMSAADSGTAWELRCSVREKLLDFLQHRLPDSLPRVRAEVDRIPAGGDPGGGVGGGAMVGGGA